MSRHYNMNISVQNIKDEKMKNRIVEILKENWDGTGSWYPELEELNFWGEDNLCGGEGEDEFAERIAKELCKISTDLELDVHATYLEDLPYNTYSFSQEKMKKLLKKLGGKT